MGYGTGWGWGKYVSVAERKLKAAKHIAAQQKKGKICKPVVIEGRTIARTFWGKAWCDNLEAYSDYSNRLPRGRTYVRNGSVIDLQVSKGAVHAQVMGSSLYTVTITINPLPQQQWQALIKACSGKIDSLVELLQGKFSKGVMEIITSKGEGLFPKPQEIHKKCSCPDGASMCKHVAAVLYGIGAALDHQPEWLFSLRHVDHLDLIASAATSELLQPAASADSLDDGDLAALFGIEIADSPTTAAAPLPASAIPVAAAPKKRGRPKKTSS
jgi:uncharacterized Zn finger protein